MTYMVFEENKPAYIEGSALWGNAEFPTKRDAEIYAFLWCNAVTRYEAEVLAPKMNLGVKYDYASNLTWHETILMSILEVVEE